MKHWIFRAVSLALALCLEMGKVAAAQDTDPEHDTDRVHGLDHDHTSIEEIIVTATPLGRDAVELSQSATVLSGDALSREASNNLGATLARQPGLANASFGQNIGRPVIRGLQGNRVGVLNDGMNSFDASAVSQDHAVPTEPFLADQVEVLRGPTTLLYGSGSIGGVVNVVTNTIPEHLPDLALEGRAMVQVDSAANQRFGAARLDAGSGSVAMHVNGFLRRTDDYEIPGSAELYPDPDAEPHTDTGRLENSFLDNQGGAIGGSWIGTRWRAGLAFTAYDADYGIPGAASHEHGHEPADPFAAVAAEEPAVSIALESRRLDAVLEGARPFRGVETATLNLAETTYSHTEFEGTETGTVFDSDTTDLRVELEHSSWGAWDGVLGGQWTDNEFDAMGEEAFVPGSKTRNTALFWVESADFGAWRMDVGLRRDWVRIDAAPLPSAAEATRSREFEPFSASAGTVWHIDERRHLTLTLAHAERAPDVSELFSLGPHIATRTFEIGDAGLDKEANRHVELTYRVHQGALTGSFTAFRSDFEDYIFQADTGLEADGLPVRIWSQQDAEFVGGEFELHWDVGHRRGGHWQFSGFIDHVRAKLDRGGNVPRIPPSRIGFTVDWDRHGWSANLSWIHAFEQRDTATYETPTPGYELLNADVTYRFTTGERVQFEAYIQGHNLLDEDIRNSTSFLKDLAPQAGRNFILGLRTIF